MNSFGCWPVCWVDVFCEFAAGARSERRTHCRRSARRLVIVAGVRVLLLFLPPSFGFALLPFTLGLVVIVLTIAM
jgi:hypothetical protein